MNEMSLDKQYELNQDKKRLEHKVARWEKKNEKNVMNKETQEYIKKRADEMEKSLFRK